MYCHHESPVLDDDLAGIFILTEVAENLEGEFCGQVGRVLFDEVQQSLAAPILYYVQFDVVFPVLGQFLQTQQGRVDDHVWLDGLMCVHLVGVGDEDHETIDHIGVDHVLLPVIHLDELQDDPAGHQHGFHAGREGGEGDGLHQGLEQVVLAHEQVGVQSLDTLVVLE